MGILLKYGFEELSWTIGKTKFGLPGRRKADQQAGKVNDHVSRAKRARLALEELGPTFIKFGQLLSTRPDLIPAEYIDQLEHLQDQVPPADWEKIRLEVKKELGGFPEEIFSEFDEKPIAAGSIGEVHRAVTKDGREVVVKIRRPKIVERLRIECEVLHDIAGIIKANFFPDDDTIDPQRMVSEFIRAVMKEADFANERRNQKRFIMNFEDDETIHIPRIFDEYCTEGVLTMEYIHGLKPGSVDRLVDNGLDPHIIAKRGADYVFKQVFDQGFFHTDPHPGNFFVMDNNILAPIDFGQAGRLGSQERRLLKDEVVAIVNNDAHYMLRALERSELVDERTDMNSLLREVESLFDRFYGLPLQDIPFRPLIQETFEIMRKHYIQLPPDFTMMMKTMMTIESFAKSLDEDFPIFDHLKPYARRFSLEGAKPSNVFRTIRKTMTGAGDMVANFPEDINAILNKFRQGKAQLRVHHEHLETLNTTLDKSSNRLSFAVIIAALLIGSSLLVPQEGTALGIIHLQTLGAIGYVLAAILGVWLIISILRSKTL